MFSTQDVYLIKAGSLGSAFSFTSKVIWASFCAHMKALILSLIVGDSAG